MGKKIKKLEAQIRFKSKMISMVDDMLNEDNEFVSKQFLRDKKDTLLNEHESLQIELAVAQQVVARNSGELNYYI